MSDIIPLARLIDMNNIKYDILQDITNAEFKGKNIEVVNLYIDVYSLLKVLYRNDTYDIETYSTITSSIVNICSHYRRFFYTRYNAHTRIFIINSQNLSDINKTLVYGYNYSYSSSREANPKIVDLIETNMDLLRTLVPYLPDIYFIDSTFETGVVIYNIMCRDDKANTKAHIILSRDKYNYQLAAMKPNTVILKRIDKDISFFVTKNNLLDIYLKERNVKSQSLNVSSELFTTILALSSLKERNIKAITSINKAISVLDQAIKDHRLVNAYNSDIEYLWNSILLYGGIKSNKMELVNRFKALDIQFQHSIFITSPERDFSDRLVNLVDPQTVKAINNKYFATNPLDLNNL